MQRAFRQASQEEYQQAAQSSKGGSNFFCLRKPIEVFLPREGNNAIRIVPFLADDPHGQIYGKEVWQYYMGGVYLSPNTFDKNLPNPLLDKYMELHAQNDDRKKRYRGQRKYVMYVFEVDKDGKAGPVKLWFAPKMIVDGIIAGATNPMTGQIQAIDDAREGKIMFFRRDGTGLSTKYLGIQFGQEAYPLTMEILDQVYLLEEVLMPMSVDQAKAFVASGGYDDSDQQSSPAAPVHSNPNMFGPGVSDFDYGANAAAQAPVAQASVASVSVAPVAGTTAGAAGSEPPVSAPAKVGNEAEVMDTVASLRDKQ